MSYTPGGAVPNLDTTSIFHGVQSIPNNVTTIITGSWVAQWDFPGIFNVATQTITIAANGKYLITVWCEFASSTTGTRRVFVRTGAGSFLMGDAKDAPNAKCPLNVSMERDMTASDTLSFTVDQDRGSSLNLNSFVAQVTRINV